MIKVSLINIVLLLCCPLGLSAQASIQGEIEAQTSIYLSAFEEVNRSYIRVDSMQSDQQGKYHFQITSTLPNLYELEIKGEGKLVLSVEKDDQIKVGYKNNNWSIQNDPNSQDIQEVRAKVRKLQEQYFGDLKKAIDQAMSNGDEEKAQSLIKEANAAVPLFVAELRALIDSFGDSPAAYYAMQFSDFNKEQVYLFQKYQQLQKAMPNSPITLALSKQLEEASASAIGKTPPMIEGTSLKGDSLSLNTFKGKYLLVDFWATWCRACRIENPKFKTLYDQYDQAKFDIISISSDEEATVWKKSIQQDGVEVWHHLQDQEEVFFQLYGVSSLPQNIVLNSEGLVIAKNVSAEELALLLEKHIK